jgi:hypothetical protein
MRHLRLRHGAILAGMKCFLGVFAAACLFPAAIPAPAQVKVTRAADRITVEIDGKPDTAFYIGADVPKPYLHPLRSASGKIVSRGYPMELIEGETRDHPHHRGVWFSHGDVNGYDFWGNEPGHPPKAGKIVLEKVVGVRNGQKSGAIEAIFEWVAPDGKRLLEESRKMIFYSDPALRTIDFDITLKALDKVVFGDTKEGTFAIRLAAGLEEPEKGKPELPKRTGKMVNAEGATGEENVWGKRSNWVDHYGEVEGETLGIAILDHPANPRHPTYWHSRAYGLFAANIFGLHDFERDKTKNGSLTLPAGGTLRFRYRVIVHPGDPQSAGIAAKYAEYAGAK